MKQFRKEHFLGGGRREARGEESNSVSEQSYIWSTGAPNPTICIIFIGFSELLIANCFS